MAVRLYHQTTRDAAASILAEGFADGQGQYMTAGLHTGVWLSDVPLDANEGAQGSWMDGDPLLEVTLNLPDSDLAAYEWVEEGKPYREFLIPAAIVNARGRVRRLPLKETMERWESNCW